MNLELKYCTDLAFELYESKNNDGFRYSREEYGYCSVARQEVLDKSNLKSRNFVTIFCENMICLGEDSLFLLSRLLSNEIKKIIFSLYPDKKIYELSYLVIGLGNMSFTADSIGPVSAAMLTSTRRLGEAVFKEKKVPIVSVFSPGVAAKTGIETFEVVNSIADKIAPDLVIAIDALAAKNCDRLGTTIQLSDAGISPGRGIGNLQKEIDENSIGCPVLSIGVPTVVDSATLVLDTLEKAGVREISDKLLSVLKESKKFFVTPKESDEIIKIASRIISGALNIVFGTIS